jgi:hypothetical protein
VSEATAEALDTIQNVANEVGEVTVSTATESVTIPAEGDLETEVLRLSNAGKSQTAIAEELGVGLTVMTVKSTSQAKDLLYRFDALRRLQDAQDPANTDARQVFPYIELEPLGHAIREGQPQVVLIDEVDKADIDFPNDLLDVLDRFEFDIEEIVERIGGFVGVDGFDFHTCLRKT